jgi:hypothetical protein
LFQQNLTQERIDRSDSAEGTRDELARQRGHGRDLGKHRGGPILEQRALERIAKQVSGCGRGYEKDGLAERERCAVEFLELA